MLVVADAVSVYPADTEFVPDGDEDGVAVAVLLDERDAVSVVLDDIGAL